MAVPEKILREVDTLRQQIEHHNRLYHSQDAPEIPDAEKIKGTAPVNFQHLSDNLMARKKVLYDGHGVAAVAATTRIYQQCSNHRRLMCYIISSSSYFVDDKYFSYLIYMIII